MANAVRVRVELRHIKDDRDHDFRIMFGKFKKLASDVMHSAKEHETYESKSRKRRRKKRESEIAIFKNKLKENFGQKQGKRRYD